MNCIARRQLHTNLAADALAVEEGSVGRIQVLENEPILIARQAAVASRNRGDVDHQVAIRPGTNCDRLRHGQQTLGTRELQGRQEANLTRRTDLARCMIPIESVVRNAPTKMNNETTRG